LLLFALSPFCVFSYVLFFQGWCPTWFTRIKYGWF
jgi:hypothetical protein